MANAFSVTPTEAQSQMRETTRRNSSNMEIMSSHHLGDRQQQHQQRGGRRGNNRRSESTGESFAIRMKMVQTEYEIEEPSSKSPSAEDAGIGKREADTQEQLQQRRNFLSTMLSATAALSAPAAYAYERSYPQDLDFVNGDISRDLARVREDRISAQKAKAKQSMDDLSSQPLLLRTKKDVLGSVVWAGALWFLAGSRSNPLVTPIANVLYDESEQQWLKDRNDGLFAKPPAPLLFVLGAVFLLLGVVVDRSVLFLAEGDSDFALELAGVSLIGGGALELGRIASGEKVDTRDDFDRDSQLADEFAEFAASRLKPGGNCHRSEVVKAFRRFYGKYRVENDQYPLTDLEIERLVRKWNRSMGNEEMSSAGFFKGIQINDQADVFVTR